MKKLKAATNFIMKDSVIFFYSKYFSDDQIKEEERNGKPGNC